MLAKPLHTHAMAPPPKVSRSLHWFSSSLQSTHARIHHHGTRKGLPRIRVLSKKEDSDSQTVSANVAGKASALHASTLVATGLRTYCHTSVSRHSLRWLNPVRPGRRSAPSASTPEASQTRIYLHSRRIIQGLARRQRPCRVCFKCGVLDHPSVGVNWAH